MTLNLTFTVVGLPKPQGSKKAFAVGGRPMLKESNALEHAAWRNAVSEAAQRAAAEHGTFGRVPLELTVHYRFPMPKSRPRADRDRGWCWKVTAPDIDKCHRAVLDALTASGLIPDDSYIVRDGGSHKVEIAAGWIGATITIREVPT